ncbi:MAG: hypothetical protein ACNA7J_12445 [Wenzhouxiangella sp.]
MRFLLVIPGLGRVVAKSEFRILPCKVVDYSDGGSGAGPAGKPEIANAQSLYNGRCFRGRLA